MNLLRSSINLTLLFVILLCLSTILCIRELPGITQIILGRDMQAGQIDDPTTMKNEIFESFTFTQHKTIYLNGTTFLVPDQVFVLDYSTEEKTSITEIYTSIIILQESMAFSYSYGYNSWFSPGMFSGSYNSYSFHELYQVDSEYMASSYLRVTNYKANLNSQIKLNPFFEQQLLNLPDQYNQTTCSHFKKFFNNFGTHYTRAGTLGGIEEKTASFSVEWYQQTNISQIEYDLNEQFFLMTSESLTEQQEQQLTQLNAVYKSTFKLLGGQPGQYNSSQSQQWVATVLPDPLIVNMEIYNFTTFLHKNYTQNKLKIEALNAAMTEYFYQPYADWQTIGVVPPSLNIKGNMNPWSELIYVVLNNIIYFPISYDFNPGYYYDIRTNLWFEMTPIKVTAGDFWQPINCAGVEDTIYCFGMNQQNFDYSYSYNIKTKIWTELVDCMTATFKGASSVAVGSYIYVTESSTGWTFVNTTQSCSRHIIPDYIWVYNTIKNTCYYINLPAPECLIYTKNIVVGDDIYSFGGRDCELYTDDCETYYWLMSNSTLKLSTSSNNWKMLEPMPVRLYSPGIAAFGNKIYVMGGSIINEYVQASPKKDIVFEPNYVIYAYDILGNFWEIVNDKSAETAEMGIAIETEGFLFYLSDNIQVMSPNNFC